MTDGGLRISGGGSTAVDTGPMLASAHVLDLAGSDLQALAAALVAAATELPIAAAPLAEALHRCRDAQRHADDAAVGLRTAALRYGQVEETVTRTFSIAAAAQAATTGAATRLLMPVVPAAALLPSLEAAVLGSGVIVVAGADLAITHRIDPQLDPAVLAALRTALSSSDDLLRGLHLHEAARDVLQDDPDGPDGTASIAGAAARLLPAPTDSVATRAVDRDVVDGPGSLTGLAARVPEPQADGPQIRIETFVDAAGTRRAIVYLAGTVTFSPASGDEPFDLGADVLGVAGRASDSERAVLAAIRGAGIGPHDPVLLVGHSQGALLATRIAQRADVDAAGVVTLGAPTGQIPLPARVPVLALAHDDDPVPGLGGAPADGEAGRRRILVRRSALDDVLPPASPFSPVAVVPGVPTHAVPLYVRTMALAEGSGDPRIVAFRRDLGPFLDARRGSEVLVRAERVRPARPTAGAAAAR